MRSGRRHFLASIGVGAAVGCGAKVGATNAADEGLICADLDVSRGQLLLGVGAAFLRGQFILRVDLETGASRRFLGFRQSSASYQGGMVLDERYLYWADQANQLRRSYLAELESERSEALPLYMHPADPEWQGLTWSAVDDSTVYWSDGGTLYGYDKKTLLLRRSKADTVGGVIVVLPDVLITGGGDADNSALSVVDKTTLEPRYQILGSPTRRTTWGSIAVDADFVYFVGDDGAIYRCSHRLTDVKPIYSFRDHTRGVPSIALSANWLYFGDAIGASSYTLCALPLGGGKSRVVLPDAPPAQGQQMIQTNSTHVYWVSDAEPPLGGLYRHRLLT